MKKSVFNFVSLVLILATLVAVFVFAVRFANSKEYVEIITQELPGKAKLDQSKLSISRIHKSMNFLIVLSSTGKHSFPSFSNKDNNADQNSLAIGIHLNGKLALAPVTGGKNGEIAIIQTEQLRYNLNGLVDESKSIAIKKSLESGFYLDRDQNKYTATFTMSPNALAQGIGDTFSAQIRNVSALKPPFAKSNWIQFEQDVYGTVSVKYEVIPTADAGKIEIIRTKLQYTELFLGSGFDIRSNSKAKIIFNAKDGALLSMNLIEEVKMTNQKQLVGESELVLNIIRDPINLNIITEDTINNIVEKIKISSISEVFKSFNLETNQDLATLGNDSFKSLIAKLQDPLRQKYGFDAEAYVKMKALFKIRPESLPEVEEFLLKTPQNSLVFSTLIQALNATATEQAQEVLASVGEASKESWPVMSRLIPALSLIENPTVRSESLLRSLAQQSTDSNIAETARLGLGNVAKQLAKSSPERALALANELVADVSKAGNSVAKAVAIEALGNTGHTESWATLSALVRQENVSIRQSAVYALRFLKDDASFEALIKSLKTDINESVRLDAAKALAFRSDSQNFVLRLLQCFNGEKLENIQIEILRTLWTNSQQDKRVIGLAQELSKLKTDRDIGKFAYSILLTKIESRH